MITIKHECFILAFYNLNTKVWFIDEIFNTEKEAIKIGNQICSIWKYKYKIIKKEIEIQIE